MTEQLAFNRQQVFFETGLALTAGQTIPQALGGTSTHYLVHKATGNGSLQGMLVGTTAPATGFPRISWFIAPGNAASLTRIASDVLTVDPLNAFTYKINTPLYTPYFSIEWTQGAAGGTLRGAAWIMPEGSGGAGGSSPPPPPTPTVLPATYRAVFTNTLAGGAGQFFELQNPVASTKVVRVTLMFMAKPSATITWTVVKQSSLSSAGTPVAQTAVPLDSANAAAQAAPIFYTAAATAGVAVGNVFQIVGMTAGDAFADGPGATPSHNQQQAIVLRPGESIAFSSNANGTFSGIIEWDEQNS